jgi:AraC family transcriptional regulator
MRLSRGQFLGIDLAGLSTTAFVVRITRYVPGARLEMHDHRNANLCLIVGGGFEDLAVGWGRAGIGAAVMHPGGMGHAQRFADGGSLAVNVELDRAWLRDVGGSDTAGLLRISPREVLEAAWRVGLALRARETDAYVAATLARVVCGTGIGPAEQGAAARGIGCVQAGGKVELVAREVGVNVSHLGREFAKRVGCSPSRMMRWERVARAAKMLEETDLPLAVVAMRAGYCDQSHLCREIRNVLGLTPRAVRAGPGMRMFVLGRRKHPRQDDRV